MLGAGGMGQVFHGWLVDQPSSRVAIKVPLPGLDVQLQELFLREAEAAQAVQGVNVVKVVDWGLAPPFIAFEYIDAPTLEHEIDRRQHAQAYWSEPELINLYGQLVSALGAINTKVIHRDLKPSNIFVVGQQVKVSDFGISKYAAEVTRNNTFKGLGSPLYMSPESFLLDTVDWRSDQYSLGIIFFEMATFRCPFEARSWAHFQYQHLYTLPQRVTNLNASLSERLASVIARMLSKRTDDRYPTWDSLKEELNSSALRTGASHNLEHARIFESLATELDEQCQRKLNLERWESERAKQLFDEARFRAYQAEEIFLKVRRRVDWVKSELGEDVVTLRKHNGDNKSTIDIHCFDAGASISVETIPRPLPNLQVPSRMEREHRAVRAGQEIFLLGANCEAHVVGGTPKFGFNALLHNQPQPYGSWIECVVDVTDLVRLGNYDPDISPWYMNEGRRLQYNLDWQSLLSMRARGERLSGRAYSERPFDWDSALDAMIRVVLTKRAP